MQAVLAATTLDACDRRISGGINKNKKIKFGKSREKPGGNDFEKILENIRLMERASIQINCKVKDAGRQVHSYEKAIDFVMETAKEKGVLKDVYDFELHQIAIAIKISGNQKNLDGDFEKIHTDTSQVVKWMFKNIIRLRKEHHQSQDAVYTTNRTPIGAMAGVALYFLIANALDRTLPEIRYSSSIVSNGVIPASASSGASSGHNSSGGL